MDTELSALASTAASTLARLLATDGWERARAGIGMLWRMVHPDHAETVEADLTQAHRELVVADQGALDHAQRDIAEEWRLRLTRLLNENPALVTSLAVLVRELQNALPQGAGVTHTSWTASASDHGRVYQAGHDLRVNE